MPHGYKSAYLSLNLWSVATLWLFPILEKTQTVAVHRRNITLLSTWRKSLVWSHLKWQQENKTNMVVELLQKTLGETMQALSNLQEIMRRI